jgi:hypothetical protein
MKLPYSSPKAYLNRFFKGKNKFKYIMSGLDQYENENFQLTWIGNETFVLAKRVIDQDVGADYFEDFFKGTLVECVNLMRGAS